MIAYSLKWSRHNLFAKPFDALLSIIVIPTVLWAVYQMISWALATAQWDIIPQSLRVLMIGVYPPEQAWRAWMSAMIIGGLLGAALGCVFALRRHHVVLLAIVLVIGGVLMGGGTVANIALLVATFTATAGGWASTSVWVAARRFLVPASVIGLLAIFAILSPPGVGLWGGLLLSVLITLVTSILTLPIGILLAFGRRSRISSVRVICTSYIEVMRSVPLILVVYWIWILMPVLAPQWGLADVARGMIGFTVLY